MLIHFQRDYGRTLGWIFTELSSNITGDGKKDTLVSGGYPVIISGSFLFVLINKCKISNFDTGREIAKL